MEGFFQPPTVDAAATRIATPTSTAAAASPTIDVAATTGSPRYPAWVLLEPGAFYDDGENATTAEAETSTGHNVKVTFRLADPPALSRVSVDMPELDIGGYGLQPEVVFSAKDLVLLRFAFTVGPRSTRLNPHLAEYFVYKTGRGKPSLTPIPTTHRPDKTKSYASILPCHEDDGNFLVADLAMTRNIGHYTLHIFSSKTNKWISRPLELQFSPVVTEDLPSLPHKVIALGSRTIGWIDLWRGIVVCDVFERHPVLHFIPLPKPELNLRRESDPQQIRDVTCCNGVIKFVEIEHNETLVTVESNKKLNFKTTTDLDSVDIIYDSELFLVDDDDDDEDLMEEESTYYSDSWKIRTCFRHTSWNHWRKGHTVHVDDILVNYPRHYMMLPELWDADIGRYTLRNLRICCPALSIDGSDVVYLICKVGAYDTKKWIVGVDLGKKTVEELEQFSAGRYSLYQKAFLAFAFSRYLNATRSCAPEDSSGRNFLPNDHHMTGYIIQNNLQNTQTVSGYYSEHGHATPPGFNNYPIQPQFVVHPCSFPRSLQPNLTSSALGYVHPVSAESMYPVMNTDPHGQVWISRPLENNRFLSQMPAPPAVPFNTQMHLPLDGRFMSQLPPMRPSLAVPFNGPMNQVWMQPSTYVPFTQPQLFLPPA
ncbi:uncharacterized protein LOC100841809 isoform X1 [Brachypodium distachyon]|uniref:DUF1618 domain-containing protein n=1 Tax=Brachypodium distachyon TaxID=15368 RepID=A0A2K2DV03_BRADI|nr:uncharacterized protein LOC100841809 isoform X1 [Brachypodium distachyon]XP_014752520.1 uncharacterized protein LOC100841809 isoform X1 [Brachypodium distachyon]PNT78107.1 hypothetical protein BRADI_1g73690v3 [Brachypodium distachyon]PNT78108.1 hypothetical protein BRADI_1g73690v3 [Brachypodium distachyon]|eukprot:XP_010229126.1 uncharacterized protein LOC100841809 isoform X1 [Brachypodium distachyon]